MCCFAARTDPLGARRALCHHQLSTRSLSSRKWSQERVFKWLFLLLLLLELACAGTQLAHRFSVCTVSAVRVFLTGGCSEPQSPAWTCLLWMEDEEDLPLPLGKGARCSCAPGWQRWLCHAVWESHGDGIAVAMEKPLPAPCASPPLLLDPQKHPARVGNIQVVEVQWLGTAGGRDRGPW